MIRLCRLLMCVVTCGVTLDKVRADALDQWTVRPPPFALQLFDVIYEKGLFLAVGMDYDGGLPRLLVSSSGSSWTRQVTGSQMTMRALAYGNGLFVAVGTVDSDCCRTPGVVVSTNGLDWKFWPNAVTGGFSAVTYGNGRFVAVGGSGTIAVSTNGTNWVTGNSATPLNLAGVAYGSGLFVATAPSSDAGPGDIERSSDGLNWTVQHGFNGGRMMFARNLFVAAAGYMPPLVTTLPIQLSGNAINWTPANAPTNDLARGLAYAGGIFVGVGTRGLIETSTDGTNWIRRNSGTTAQLRGVAYGAGTFVAVGDIILQSANVGPRLRFEQCCSQGTYHLVASGVSNSVGQIQSSTNLISWQPGASFRITNTEVEILRTNASGPRRFYKAQLAP